MAFFFRTKSKAEGAGSTQAQLKHRAFYASLADKDSASVFSLLKTDPFGLTDEEALKRLGESHANEITREKLRSLKQLRTASMNPFILLLAGLAITSFFANDLRGAIVMTAMALISLSLTLVQELRADRAASQLKAMVSTNCTVLRRPGGSDEHRSVPFARYLELPMSVLVSGDIIGISAGDMVPADCRLISSKDLHVSQAQLTGESIPVEKSANPERGEEIPFLEHRNLCFMGSNVMSGTATAVVLKTGNDTYLGSIARNLTGQRVQTAFDKGIYKFTWLMLRFMLVMIPLVFLINGLTKGDWYEAFMFALAIAVGLTPEMLPMIVTVNLAKGAMTMAKKRVIVKRLHSIQNFGAMDTLCTDKTGTLTQNKVVLEKYIDLDSHEDFDVLKYAYLNSFYQTGLKNLLDVAILKHQEIPSNFGIEKEYKKIDEIPFDFERKRMSVVVEHGDGPERTHIMICKGSLEELFSACSQALVGHNLISIDDAKATHCFQMADEFYEDGFRVIAIAYKQMPPDKHEYSVADESGLILRGLMAFLDPPKETAQEAIEALSQQGVTVKVLTGDNGRIARKICKEVGIAADNMLLGTHIEQMTDEDLKNKVEEVHLFAKLTPTHKERIVKALQQRNRVVGFLGDGINDALALRSADVGISVDNAVDVAKESADIILLEKNLLVLKEGVIEGRKVFGNIIKYIKMGASSNFGNVFTVLVASAILPFLPMLPVQFLAQNLLYDISQTAIPSDNVDPEYVQRPRRWEIKNIGLFMLFMGPLSSIFDCATFLLMWFFFRANAPEHAELFQSGWFVEGLLSQTLIIHVIRTQKIPFLESRASKTLLLMSLFVAATGIILPFTHLGASIGLVGLPLSYFCWLILILTGYCCLAQLVKSWFVKRYGF